MTAQPASRAHAQTSEFLRSAVHHNRKISKQGLLERLFTLWFRGFIYNQIWEDPRVDAEAMQLGPGNRVLTISSGGCNVLNYLTYDPDRIVAVDLNTCHMSLTRLKLAALRHLPSHEAFYTFFGLGAGPENLQNYHRYIREHLDETTREYWESSAWPTRKVKVGPKRIKYFKKGLYNQSKLGQLIRFAHLVGKVTRTPYQELLRSRTVEEQQRFFDDVIAPYFDNKFVRMMTANPVTGFSLGIPPSQFKIMHTESNGKMPELYRERVRKLIAQFPMEDNYFAWQAFGRRYDHENRKALPDYLRQENWPALRDRVDRVETHIVTLTKFLQGQQTGALDRFVLLDSQDWMPPHVIAELWQEIDRVAPPGGRVIFRTSGTQSAVEGKLPVDVAARWRYERQQSEQLHMQDRSAIYGMFHLYVKAQA
jgi:S-adenosylmethionine-diacylglycerol 3-amino-3-carboxypropyl transferase